MRFLGRDERLLEGELGSGVDAEGNRFGRVFVLESDSGRRGFGRRVLLQRERGERVGAIGRGAGGRPPEGEELLRRDEELSRRGLRNDRSSGSVVESGGVSLGAGGSRVRVVELVRRALSFDVFSSVVLVTFHRRSGEFSFLLEHRSRILASGGSRHDGRRLVGGRDDDRRGSDDGNGSDDGSWLGDGSLSTRSDGAGGSSGLSYLHELERLRCWGDDGLLFDGSGGLLNLELLQHSLDSARQAVSSSLRKIQPYRLHRRSLALLLLPLIRFASLQQRNDPIVRSVAVRLDEIVPS